MTTYDCYLPTIISLMFYGKTYHLGYLKKIFKITYCGKMLSVELLYSRNVTHSLIWEYMYMYTHVE